MQGSAQQQWWADPAIPSRPPCTWWRRASNHALVRIGTNCSSLNPHHRRRFANEGWRSQVAGWSDDVCQKFAVVQAVGQIHVHDFPAFRRHETGNLWQQLESGITGQFRLRGVDNPGRLDVGLVQQAVHFGAGPATGPVIVPDNLAAHRNRPI